MTAAELGGGAVAAGAVFSLLSRSVGPVLMIAGWFAVHVSVTPRRLVIDSEAFPLSAIRSVRSFFWRAPYTVEIASEHGACTRSLPDVPRGLEEALAARGVRLEL